MATWPKHLRPRWRYLAVDLEVPGDVDLTRDDLQGSLWRGLKSLFGDATSARVGMDLVRLSLVDGRGQAIIRVARDGVEEARAVLATVDRVADRPIRFDVRGVSGTIRGCEESYLGDAGEPASQDTVTFDDVETTAVVRDETVDIRIDSTPVGVTTLDTT